MYRAFQTIVPLDPKIERTLRRTRRCALQGDTEDQQEGTLYIELPLMEQMTKEANRRALRDFALSGGNGLQMSITRPTVNANNFEIKPTLI